MLKIAICDDEASELAETYASIEKYSNKRMELDVAGAKNSSIILIYWTLLRHTADMIYTFWIS